MASLARAAFFINPRASLARAAFKRDFLDIHGGRRSIAGIKESFRKYSTCKTSAGVNLQGKSFEKFSLSFNFYKRFPWEKNLMEEIFKGISFVNLKAEFF